MPPKADPYSNNAAQTGIDIILITITTLVMFLVFHSATYRQSAVSTDPAEQSQTLASK
jgi:hypothetical protein